MQTTPGPYTRTQTLRLPWRVLPLTMAGVRRMLLGADAQQVRTPVPLGVWIAAFALSWPALLVLGRFTVQLDERELRWNFGFFGWPRWFEGQGIRCKRHGMLYNAASGGAVRLHVRNGKQIRLGSDEPERLATFIRSRLPRS